MPVDIIDISLSMEDPYVYSSLWYVHVYSFVVFIYAYICNNCIVSFTFSLWPYQKDQFSGSCFKPFSKVVHGRTKCLQNMSGVFSIFEFSLSLKKAKI